MLVDDVKSRLAAQVDALDESRIKLVADFADLLRRGALPQNPVTAFVLPSGLTARSEGDAGAGAFTQMIDEMVSVVLVVRAAGDATGAKSLPTLDQLVWAVVAAVCGWGPDAAIGVFRLSRGQLLSNDAGASQYQLDFAIQQQVRIIA